MICQHCGKCCTEKTICLSDQDILNISTHHSSDFFIVRKTGAKVMKWKKQNDRHICIFLNPNNNKCSIYEYRPKVCREYNCFS